LIDGSPYFGQLFAKLLRKDIGFETIGAGKLNIARLLEPLAMWIHVAFMTRFCIQS